MNVEKTLNDGVARGVRDSDRKGSNCPGIGKDCEVCKPTATTHTKLYKQMYSETSQISRIRILKNYSSNPKKGREREIQREQREKAESKI